jgi:predicted transcriptional regulator
MASQDRRFILDHVYKLQTGKECKRSELIEIIKKSIKSGNFTSSQISRHIKLDMKQLGNVMRHMIDKDIIISQRGNTKGGGYIYALKDECLLANILMLKPNDIDKAFKVNSTIRRKIEDGTTKSSRSNSVTYTTSLYDSVYWG